MKHWRTNPLSWVSDRFGDAVKLSTQQTLYMKELRNLIISKEKSFLSPDKLTDRERLYASKIGISIMAGQGVGKDFCTALTMMYFLDVFPYPKVTATGVTGKHLRNILWAECSKIMRLSKKTDPNDPQSPTILEYNLEWQTERIFRKGLNKAGSEWFAEAVTINPHASEDEQAKTLYGRHEAYQLIVIDEAASVPEPIFGPLEGTLTSRCAIALMIFNPTRSKGYAYDSHHGRSDQWITLNWNAEESELVSKDHLAKMLRYGRDSNTYRIKVRGLPPVQGDGGLIPYDRINEAIDREFDVSEFDPVMCGVDVGGGGDMSVVSVRQGPLVKIFEKSTTDPDQLADWVANILHLEEHTVAFVDNIGLGWGVVKSLQNRGINARPADSRSVKDLVEPEKFHNKRAEMYWTMAQAFIHGAISIPNNEDLINELGAITMEASSFGNKLKVRDKKELRKILGFSPDRSDAIAFSFYRDDSYFRKTSIKLPVVRPRMPSAMCA